MRIINIIFLIITTSIVWHSCNTDDDICVGGEGTPRLKVKFKTQATGNLRTMDSLFVYVDYGSGKTPVISRKIKTDSVLIPLRVEDLPYTDIYVGTSQKGIPSKIRINYTTKNEYVSPACGIKRLYENLNPSLIDANPVKSVEKNQNEILDEQKTHIFLLF